MNRRLAVTSVVAVLAIVAGVTFRMRTSGDAVAATRAAELFYQQTLQDASGAPLPMATHRGHVVVVNFWATWCVPCVQEIPAFSKASAAARGKVAFVGLGIDSPDNIAAFDARFKPSYPLVNAAAAGTDLARAFGNEAGALPFTVVVGADGRIVASHLGKVDAATLARWLKPYLGSAADSAVAFSAS